MSANREQRRSEAKESKSPTQSVSKTQLASMETCLDTVEIQGIQHRKVGAGYAAYKAYMHDRSVRYMKTGRFSDAMFACGGCTACCHQRVEIFDTESPVNLKHLDVISDPDGPPGARKLRQNDDSSCVHLGEHGCTVYEHRPKACRAYDCRLYAFYGFRIDHEHGGPEPRWRFGTDTKEDKIICASMELLAQTYRGSNEIRTLLEDRKSRLESAIDTMRGLFDKHERHLASLTHDERKVFEAQMEADVDEYNEGLVSG